MGLRTDKVLKIRTDGLGAAASLIINYLNNRFSPEARTTFLFYYYSHSTSRTGLVLHTDPKKTYWSLPERVGPAPCSNRKRSVDKLLAHSPESRIWTSCDAQTPLRNVNSELSNQCRCDLFSSCTSPRAPIYQDSRYARQKPAASVSGSARDVTQQWQFAGRELGKAPR